ncbi:MAG TPA: hypothetical protein VFW02_06085, partial [Candidatus Limnocylindrales bacterium]|nr:hypothetical protein [Candidatus Limnocylindrales bacterium]
PSVSTVPATPSASPSPVSSAELDRAYDTIEDDVVAIRGLEPKRDVARQFIDEAELRTLITEQFDAETPPAYLAATERLYKALDLIPADTDLRDLTLDLLSGGVAGFYRDDQNTLYVVSKTGLPGVNERITFAHEYDHALQDQNTSVFKDQDGILDQTDRILARQAIYEGDASLLMTVWASTHFDLSDLAELLTLSSDPEAQALLNRMPAILRETLVFPYTTGLSFVQAAQLRGGWEAVDDFYDRMPESTEQILHPDSYRTSEHPVAVDLPDDLASQLGAGWSVPLEDTFGEFQLGIWLREAGVAATTAQVATAGWGGDRLAVAEGPDGAWGVVLETTWDSEADATEFLDAAQSAVDGLSSPARISAPVGQTVTILVASDEKTLLALDVLFGATGV